jgi:transposase
MSAADAVRNYKALANVERAFRSLKTVDLKVRPIHHRLEHRVRAHIFLWRRARPVYRDAPRSSPARPWRC